MPVEMFEKPATVDDVLKEVARIKAIVTDAVEDGVKTAVKAIRQGRDAAEDAIDEAKRSVKRRPFEAMGIVFAAGVLTGALLSWAGSRRR